MSNKTHKSYYKVMGKNTRMCEQMLNQFGLRQVMRHYKAKRDLLRKTRYQGIKKTTPLDNDKGYFKKIY